MSLVISLVVATASGPWWAQAPGGRGRERPRAFVVAARRGRTPSDRPVEARRGDRVWLYAVLRVRRRGGFVYLTRAPRLRLHGHRISPRRLRPPPARGFSVRWLRVEPRQHHVSTPAPNARNPAYANAVLFGPHHGRWLGFDRLEYEAHPVPGAGDAPVLVVDRARPSHPRVNVHAGLGTMRYAVWIRWRGRVVRGPGAEAVDRYGIRPAVLRVSFRESDDFVGYLTSYFNVPNVFGSAGPGRNHQTERYVGADCADVLVGAVRRAGARVGYTSASGLTRLARAVTPRLRLDRSGLTYFEGARRGQRVRLRFGRDVRRGDLMLIDYLGWAGSPRSWDHVAALARDRGTRGWLDPRDRVIHMGYLWGLVDAPLGSEGPAIVKFLRWRPRIQRQLRWHRRRVARARRQRLDRSKPTRSP